jgi:hypothetical protein
MTTTPAPGSPPGPIPAPGPLPPPPPEGSERAGGLVRSGWDALVVLLILTALALVFYIAVSNYRTSTTDAAAVLGAVIPAIATVGAAAFGVATGVRAGQQAGTQQATAALRHADELEQVTRRQQQAMLRLVPISSKLADQLSAMSQQLYKASYSPPGKGTLTIGPPSMGPAAPDDERVQHIDPATLDEMQVAAGQIAAVIDSALY